ncbi:MAG: hypothetical protein J0M36_12095, partial [Caulobacterales bacterium]|nr:hypothetical protein [Caulobacterales bacterium]
MIVLFIKAGRFAIAAADFDATVVGVQSAGRVPGLDIGHAVVRVSFDGHGRHPIAVRMTTPPAPAPPAPKPVAPAPPP